MDTIISKLIGVVKGMELTRMSNDYSGSSALHRAHFDAIYLHYFYSPNKYNGLLLYL